MSEEEHTKQEFDAAVSRLNDFIQEHGSSSSARLIRDVLEDKPVRPSEIAFSLDRGNRADVLLVIKMAYAYTWPRFEDDAGMSL